MLRWVSIWSAVLLLVQSGDPLAHARGYTTGNVAASVSERTARPNVLFLILDDLNDWVGCLEGHPDARTPNIDGLAERGVLFTNAQCTSPICGPSRAAVLTGMRPETTGVYHNRGRYKTYVPDAVALPRHFRDNGYLVMGGGKINHGLGEHEPENWDLYGPGCGIVGTPFTHDELKCEGMMPAGREIVRHGKVICRLPMNGGISLIDRPGNQWDTFDWGGVPLPDSDFPDGELSDWAVGRLQERHGKPFFLGVGIYKPHQPFFLPEGYFGQVDPMKIRLPETVADDLEDVPEAGQAYARVAWTSGTHETVVKHNQWRQAVAAYLATVAFADAQVGKVVDALDAGDYADNTWIVLWSDHGWTLGEKAHWGKQDPWRGSGHVPLIIVPPKNAAPEGFSPGVRCDAPVNLLDLYPTLIDMCSLPTRAELEGRSLARLVANPRAESREATVMTVGRGSHAVCDRRWRYVHYYDGSEELYDHAVDPEEWFNLAGDKRHITVKARLARHLVRDSRVRQYVRWGRYKMVVTAEGSAMLFDMRGRFGISEQFDLAEERPQIVAAIREYLKKNEITDRHVTMPGEREEG